MKFISKLALIACIAIDQAMAWGGFGHLVVARIAYELLQ